MRNKAADEHEGISEETIALRAYELYCARGCENGRDIEDWLTAERLILEELRPTVPPANDAKATKEGD